MAETIEKIKVSSCTLAVKTQVLFVIAYVGVRDGFLPSHELDKEDMRECYADLQKRGQISVSADKAWLHVDPYNVADPSVVVHLKRVRAPEHWTEFFDISDLAEELGGMIGLVHPWVIENELKVAERHMIHLRDRRHIPGFGEKFPQIKKAFDSM